MLTDYCTVVSEVAGLSQMLAAVRAAAPEARVEVEGQPDHWKIVRLTSAGASLKLTTMHRDKPGDAFSKLVLGLHNHFREAARANGRTGQQVLDRVLMLHLAVGVVAEPAMEHEKWLEQVILAAAGAVSGMIFDGHDLLSSDGAVLLASGK
jgi:hypothetical protein